MKAIVLISLVLFSTLTVASELAQCSSFSSELCKDLKGRDFAMCYNAQMEICLNDSDDQYMKSIPGCFDICNLLQDADQKKVCFQVCEGR